MTEGSSIPAIDVALLFEPPSRARDAVDRDVLAAAVTAGFMTITGLPEDVRFDTATRHRLLRLFAAPRKLIDALCCNREDPSRPLVYYGWFELLDDRPSYFEGMLIGPDVAHGESVVDASDPLKRPTPMPSETDLPGWRADIRDYYLGMERAADAMMRSIGRSPSVLPSSHQVHYRMTITNSSQERSCRK